MKIVGKSYRIAAGKISVYSSLLKGTFVITADYTFREAYVSNLTWNFG